MRPDEDPGDSFTQVAALNGAGDEGTGSANAPAVSMERGRDVLVRAVKTLPGGPGVYRMLSRKGEPLYVGKARNLKKRVYTYTQLAKLPYRIQRMVAETASLEVVTTHTEVEALLLESNLVKRLMPRYNVQLRDDKSFPYILLTGDHDFPRIMKHRGAHTQPGDYYGPFASAGAVNRTITALEKAFLLRSCTDHVFAARSRPCLMYHIKRCSAPCVDYISKEDYAKLVQQARDFLSGRSQEIQRELQEAMQDASDRLDFESAAIYRDRVRALAHIQSHQDINVAGVHDADVIALHQEAGQTCIQVFFFRAGRNYGNRAYFPGHDRTLEPGEILASFLAQFYDNKPVPRLLLLSHAPDDRELLAEALAERAQAKVEIHVPQRGDKRKLVDHALTNAREALARHLSESNSQRRLLEGLAEHLGLEQAPERIEVYDNSHTRGSEPYGAMIVAGPEGFRKNQYRKFKIRTTRKLAEETEGAAPHKNGESTAAPGDDYAMMREVLTRRFQRAMKEDPDNQSGQWPDLVLVDGGRGQLNTALEVFADLGISDVPMVGVAKGPDRDAGRERIFLPERQPMLLNKDDPVLYFIQRLRDEAHRFAIGTHRAGRGKARLRSALDDVPGIGAKRKRALLLHFGSAKAVAAAGLADLEAVEGISKTVARKVYDHFHSAA
ncbi:excinuclease ABC subunit UvrC [Ferruginivarius sediminum]|uniref:UvrABC system protein C n=2 Tax=Ferruginivarius sediminum TaxID=2661937 RepID=A0A369TBA1_9PROT|nr:excinuclease ABC subunit UvrC [Ferruginivarius sediminum]